MNQQNKNIFSDYREGLNTRISDARNSTLNYIDLLRQDIVNAKNQFDIEGAMATLIAIRQSMNKMERNFYAKEKIDELETRL